MTAKKKAPEQVVDASGLLPVLQRRFEQHRHRHEGVTWKEVEAKLEAAPEKLRSLQQMEETGGEPDVVILSGSQEGIIFCDCAPESPKGRRSVCYDRDALESRKEHPPKHSAVEMAMEMGIELLDETQYRQLQALGPFDEKTSSWIRTPDAVREHGGALFGDYRYAHTFIYHNGAQSYYAARAFRGLLRL